MRIFIPIFLIFSLWALLPFGVEQTLLQTQQGPMTPAGEFIAGKVLTQDGALPESLNSPTTRHLCFGVRFATYARKNAGTLDVSWKQERIAASWRIPSSKLDDNQIRFFCPKGGLELGAPFQIQITSQDGSAAHSPTAWLTMDNQFGTAIFDGKALGKGLSLAFANHTDLTLKHIIHLDKGAYFAGWLMTLLIGLAALLLPSNLRSRAMDPDLQEDQDVEW